MQCLFGDKIPLPTEDNITNIAKSNAANTKTIQRFVFDSQGKTITKNKFKKLLYNRQAEVHSIVMELMLLSRHNYTDVINMPGKIEDIVKFASMFEICVHDKRNLRRIIDHCGDLVTLAVKERASVYPEESQASHPS